MITLHVPEAKLAAVNELVNQGFYPNRAEAIRTAINDLLRAHGAIPQVKVREETEKDIQRTPSSILPYTERRGPPR